MRTIRIVCMAILVISAASAKAAYYNDCIIEGQGVAGVVVQNSTNTSGQATGTQEQDLAPGDTACIPIAGIGGTSGSVQFNFGNSQTTCQVSVDNDDQFQNYSCSSNSGNIQVNQATVNGYTGLQVTCSSGGC